MYGSAENMEVTDRKKGRKETLANSNNWCCNFDIDNFIPRVW